MAMRALFPSENLPLKAYVDWGVQIISDQWADYTRYEDYYEGNHKLEFATDRWREVFGNEFKEFSDNWCQVVIDTAVQRLDIKGFKSEDTTSDADEAENIWDANTLEVDAEDLHTQTFVKGDGYLIVWPNEENESGVDVFYNDAVQVAVAYDPSNRRRIIRAAKRYDDSDNQRWLMLYFPDHIERWVVPNQVTELQLWQTMNEFGDVPSGWVADDVNIANPYGQVPVFHFRNRGRGQTHGISELKNVIPVQNAVNKLLMDLMVGSEFGSFRQKWMAGGGHPKGGWKTGANRMWATTDPNAKFGEFGQIDLESLVLAIDLTVGHVAKITQTPLHYLRSSGDMPSGEALKTAESGLVKKCQARHKHWGATWADAMTFAVKISKGSSSRVTPVWLSPETRHDLEQAQTAQLKSILGIPLEVLWSEHFGYSEEEIAGFKKKNLAIAASVLARVIAQVGQLPPGTENVAASPEQLTALLAQGQKSQTGGMDISQILALLPKSLTSTTTAGEATTKPQPNSRPPASPTRRSSGFRD